jgi:hypothetical protein
MDRIRLTVEEGGAPVSSNRNPLHLIERDLIAGAVVELGGARTFVRRHGLGVFERASGFQIGGDSGCPEGVASRRWTMRQASTRCMAVAASVPVRMR